MTGVILCGGASSRMRSDKGLLNWKGRMLAQHAFDTLSSFNIPVFLSVNDHNYGPYRAYFDSSILIKDNHELKVGGPLKGLLSVHQLLPEEPLLVLAVDMPQMHPVVLYPLIKTHTEIGADAFVFENEKGLEPLCAIYAASGLRKISNLLAQGKLSRFSMHYVLAQMDTKVLTMDETMQPFFLNCNHPDDLRDLGL